LGIEISCSQWKAQGCIQGALLLFFFKFLGGEAREGWGEGFFSFFFGSQCVPQHNIIMCSFSLPPIKTPGRRDLVSVRSKSRSAGLGLFVTDLSLPHPPRRAWSVKIQECQAVGPGLSVTDLSLPTPHARPGQTDRLTELKYRIAT